MGRAACVATMQVLRLFHSGGSAASPRKQNVPSTGGLHEEKNFLSVRSRNVHENKQKKDNLPDEMSDIYVRTTRILQKTPGFERQIVVLAPL
jgi:hypothetical protein